MRQSTLSLVLISGAAVLFLLANSLFIVTQVQQALVLQFGKHVATVREPGLKMKIPFIQNVVYFDKRLLDFTAEPKEVIAADQKRLIVSSYARYRITDPLKFYQTVGDERRMIDRLNSIVESSLRQSIGHVPLSAVLSAERAKIMEDIKKRVNQQASGVMPEAPENPETEEKAQAPKLPAGGFGVEVVDVRIMRADLPQENSEAIYRRMQTEREREAKEFRAQGEEESQRIRSRADRDRTVLIAEAQKQAEITRGQGDAEAIKIFAQSFGRDEEFFAFYRTLKAYRTALGKQDTTLILSPDNSFLRYLEQGARP
ncbi:MAG: protease modulator HflC [Alphaproteobacteria bacterium]|nr:protease modulator HflC [Alphaproteobacteria bacterium]